MNMKDYYLDLEAVSKLDKIHREMIMKCYDNLIIYNSDLNVIPLLVNTLLQTGYFKSVRDSKIDKIINNDI